MSDLQKYIDRKLRLAKLDSALLFFSSSLSLAFGVGYGLLGLKWLQYYLPMLLLGWIMPIYVGYVRGSLLKESVEERIRGWIYFVVGLGFYTTSPLLSALVGYFVELNIYLSLTLGILSAIFSFILGFYSSEVICNIFRIQRKDLKKEVRQAIRETSFAALFLTIMLSFISTIDWSKFYNKLDLMTYIGDTFIIIMLFVIFVVAILSEKKARKLLQDAYTHN